MDYAKKFQVKPGDKVNLDKVDAGFEKILHNNGTHILKFYLHIDADEQLKRFKKRLDDPQRHWRMITPKASFLSTRMPTTFPVKTNRLCDENILF